MGRLFHIGTTTLTISEMLSDCGEASACRSRRSRNANCVNLAVQLDGFNPLSVCYQAAPDDQLARRSARFQAEGNSSEFGHYSSGKGGTDAAVRFDAIPNQDVPDGYADLDSYRSIAPRHNPLKCRLPNCTGIDIRGARVHPAGLGRRVGRGLFDFAGVEAARTESVGFEQRVKREFSEFAEINEADAARTVGSHLAMRVPPLHACPVVEDHVIRAISGDCAQIADCIYLRSLQDKDAA